MGRWRNDGEMSKKKVFNKSRTDNFYKAHIYIQRVYQRLHADEPCVIIKL